MYCERGCDMLLGQQHGHACFGGHAEYRADEFPGFGLPRAVEGVRMTLGGEGVYRSGRC